MDVAEDVLFLAQSAGASCYHRTMLPATTLGCDWGGLDSPPPQMILGRGEVRFDQARASLTSAATASSSCRHRRRRAGST